MPSSDTAHVGAERRQRILADLRTHGPSKAAEVARRLNLTASAVHAQLVGLERVGEARKSMADGRWTVDREVIAVASMLDDDRRMTRKRGT